ncbi:MAG: right-handed parallel beta-helix repeat-containing protein [Planctomyces sp.]
MSTSLLPAAWLAGTQADQRPPVTSPRATDGDTRHEPEWEERFTITVGPESGGSTPPDLAGKDDRVIQAAVDYVARLGGGTVRLLPGTYKLRAAIVLASGIRLTGSGPETVITRIPSESVRLAADSDWYDQEVTLENIGSFRTGDSVVFLARNPHDNGPTVVKRKIVARSGNRIKLNDGLRDNLWLSGEPTCSSLFPLLTSENASDVTIENLTLDGNRENVANFNGNYGGGIFLQDCTRFTFRKVESRNYNGDGFSFQICHDVVADECHSHDNADLGMHPGSGSQRPLIRNCVLERNGLGLFWCWGVKYGLAEGNRILDNRDYGISVGHNDTDNVMRNNEIRGNGKIGILFRDEARGLDFWGNRNTIDSNRIIDNGGEDGVAIDVQGKTKDIIISRNEIRETRQPMNRTAVRISSVAERIQLTDNRIEGFMTAVMDQRPRS